MEDRLAVVAVHPGGQTLRQEEGGRVLQETGPHTGRQLLQEEGSELTPDGGQALLGGTVISDSNIFSVETLLECGDFINNSHGFPLCCH